MFYWPHVVVKFNSQQSGGSDNETLLLRPGSGAAITAEFGQGEEEEEEREFISRIIQE